MRILIVDDDEIFCRFLVEVFEGMGMQTAWTTSGLAGYAMITEQNFDLCIIDFRMPLILGTDLVEAIREDCPHVKIILLAWRNPTALPEEPLDVLLDLLRGHAVARRDRDHGQEEDRANHR